MHTTGLHAIQTRMLELTQTLSAGCDYDFDAAYDDLDREFQELRMQLPSCNGDLYQ